MTSPVILLALIVVTLGTCCSFLIKIRDEDVTVKELIDIKIPLGVFGKSGQTKPDITNDKQQNELQNQREVKEPYGIYKKRTGIRNKIRAIETTTGLTGPDSRSKRQFKTRGNYYESAVVEKAKLKIADSDKVNDMKILLSQRSAGAKIIMVRKRRSNWKPSNQSKSQLQESQEIPNCPRQLSCRGKCSNIRQFQTDDRPRCFCDIYCRSFGDCCADYGLYCCTNSSLDKCNFNDGVVNRSRVAQKNSRSRTLKSLYSPEMRNKTAGNTSFKELELEKTKSWKCVGSKSVWMMTKCPDTWPRDTYISNCESAPRFSYNVTKKDFRWSVPVFSTDGNVYRNRFCAWCNGKKSMKGYKVFFECDTTPPSQYSAKQAMEFLFTYCSSATWKPAHNQPRRYCQELKSSCRKQTPSNVTENCSSGEPGIVFGKYGNYRNTDCASCNGDRAIRCGPEKPLKLISSETAESKASISTKPFSLIFNFDDEGGGVSETVLNIKCPIKTPIFDPYLEECRKGIAPSPTLSAEFDTYRLTLHIYAKLLQNCSEVTQEDFAGVAETKFGLKKSMISNINILRVSENQLKIKFDLRLYRPPKKHDLPGFGFDRMIEFTNPFNFSINGTAFIVFKVSKRVLTCIDLEEYKHHEYTVLSGPSSAVYLNKSGELIQSRDYYSKEGENGTIKLCRKRLTLGNCSGVYIELVEQEYAMTENMSIYVNSSRRVLSEEEYYRENTTVWICVDFPTTFKTSSRNNPDQFQIMTVTTLVGMSVSIVALSFVLVTYCLFSELRTPPGINLMNLSTAILLSQLLWIVGSGQTQALITCTSIAVLLHYLFLVSFIWTSIIAFDTWRAFSTRGRRPLADSKRQKFVNSMRCMAVGWLPTVIYVTICVALDLSNTVTIGYADLRACWINNGKANLYFFGIPVGIMLVFNAILYALTVKAIRSTANQAKFIAEHSQNRCHFGIYVRIGSLMGFTWVFGFAAAYGSSVLWYPFVVLNTLEGVYIAVAFGLSKRARKLYMDLIKGRRSARGKSLSSSSGRRENNTKISLLGSQKMSATETPL